MQSTKVVSLLVVSLAVPFVSAAATEPLQLRWGGSVLTISGPQVPGGEIEVRYLEAYCRAGSTEADWGKTVIRHRSELLEANANRTLIRLQDVLDDGLCVTHEIRSTSDEVRFEVTAHNLTAKRSEAHWAQPCIRLDRFTGANQETYLPKSFIFVGGRLTRLPTQPWATAARYTPGQVWCPAGVDRRDVNPRPLSSLVPSNGLIGCFSADEKRVFAVAFAPHQELFQGVFVCLHSDFRLGGLQPGEMKKIRGRIYIVPDVPELLRRYEADFPKAGRLGNGPTNMQQDGVGNTVQPKK